MEEAVADLSAKNQQHRNFKGKTFSSALDYSQKKSAEQMKTFQAIKENILQRESIYGLTDRQSAFERDSNSEQDLRSSKSAVLVPRFTLDNSETNPSAF